MALFRCLLTQSRGGPTKRAIAGSRAHLLAGWEWEIEKNAHNACNAVDGGYGGRGAGNGNNVFNNGFNGNWTTSNGGGNGVNPTNAIMGSLGSVIGQRGA